MKIISKISITSMNGVTLISWSSAESSFAVDTSCCGLSRSRDGGMLVPSIQVAGDQAQDLGGRIAEERPVSADRARKLIVDDDRRDGGEQANSCGEQRLGDPGGNDSQIRRLRFGDANEAVHDAPHRAEQTDKRRRGANGGEEACAPVHISTGCDFEARQSRGDAFLDPVLVGNIGGEAQFDESRVDEGRQMPWRPRRGRGAEEGSFRADRASAALSCGGQMQFDGLCQPHRPRHQRGKGKSENDGCTRMSALTNIDQGERSRGR
jgi:hypothetical protein